jgi:hypothetical protein
MALANVYIISESQLMGSGITWGSLEAVVCCSKLLVQKQLLQKIETCLTMLVYARLGRL